MSFLTVPITPVSSQNWIKATLNRWAAELRRVRFLDLPIDGWGPEKGEFLRYDGQFWRPGTLKEAFSEAGQLYENISITAGAEVGTTHTLGSTPSMIIFTYRNGGVFEDGPTAHTDTTFYIRNAGSVDGTVSALVLP